MIKIDERLVLATIQPEDQDRLVSLANDPIFRKNLGDTMPYPYTQEDAAYWIAHCQKLDGVSAQQYGIYIDGIYAGNCGWEIKEGGRKAQNYRLGYWIGEAYRGQGYSTKIVAGLTERIFAHRLDCHRIYAAVFAYNPASRRVLEKNGFVLEGTMREAVCWEGAYYDEWYLSKLRSEK